MLVAFVQTVQFLAGGQVLFGLVAASPERSEQTLLELDVVPATVGNDVAVEPLQESFGQPKTAPPALGIELLVAETAEHDGVQGSLFHGLLEEARVGQGLVLAAGEDVGGVEGLEPAHVGAHQGEETVVTEPVVAGGALDVGLAPRRGSVQRAQTAGRHDSYFSVSLFLCRFN